MKSDRAIIVCAVLLAALYFFAIGQIPTRDIGDPLGPKAIPRILGVVLLLSVGMLALEMVFAKKNSGAKQDDATPEDWGHSWVVGAIVALTILYFLVFELLGYAISTSIYLLILTSCFNRGRGTMNVLTSVLFSFASYLMFTKLFGAQLAPGLLPF